MGSVVLHKKASRWGAFFVFALWAGAAQALCPLPEAGEPMRVERVVDGDTVRLAGGRRVRLIGINAPELGGQGRAGEPFAQAARRALEVRVRESGDTLRLVPGLERRDAHGRELAHLYDRDGRNLAALLLEDGLAFQVAVAPNLRLVDCHRQLERRARVARRGLWERDPYLAPGQLTRPGGAQPGRRVAGAGWRSGSAHRAPAPAGVSGCRPGRAGRARSGGARLGGGAPSARAGAGALAAGAGRFPVAWHRNVTIRHIAKE